MHCPNCQHILTQVELENVQVEHCNNCGGSLFEANEINRITRKDAERLSMMKLTDVLSNGTKISPRDGSPLIRIDSPSIPQHVILLQSKATGEIFAFADDLIAFKDAQDAKVNYYRSWKIPMPQISQVMVFSFAILASAGLAYFASLLSTPQTQTTQAQTLCEGGIGQVQLDAGHVVSCTTMLDLGCTLKATCQDGTELPLTCSGKTYFTTAPSSCTHVQFTYTDGTDSLSTPLESLR